MNIPQGRNDRGFTLIELLVIIIGILAAIAIPAFMNQKRPRLRRPSEGARTERRQAPRNTPRGRRRADHRRHRGQRHRSDRRHQFPSAHHQGRLLVRRRRHN